MTVRLRTGTNGIVVVARDAAGNERQAVVTVEVTAPPLAGQPGFAAPGVGASALVVLGAAACIIIPLLARRFFKRAVR